MPESHPTRNTTSRIAVVGIPGKWSTEVLADAVEKQTGFRLVVSMDEVEADLERNALRFRDQNLCQLDGLLVKKIDREYSPDTASRLELLRMAEARGVRVFSPTHSIAGLLNRASCTLCLHGAGIPMPPTVVTESIDAALAAVQRFRRTVFKPLYSTKARGMCVVDADQDPQAVVDQIRNFNASNPVMYIQQRLTLPGRDLGLVFLGGNYLGCYARIADQGSWNTTIHSGGRYGAFEPPPSYIDIARRAQAVFELDFTTVDLAETDAGPVVFEVSAFGGFRGALEGAGIDAASAYARYALQKM